MDIIKYSEVEEVYTSVHIHDWDYALGVYKAKNNVWLLGFDGAGQFISEELALLLIHELEVTKE